tara:strand:- start:4996 stop:5877 length:882 start_codon:yes stop_codon:yes gene_type:complete
MPPIMIRKKYGHTVSVLQGSNKVIACSKADWLPLKTGGFIIISGDDEFYKISHKEKFMLSKEALVEDRSKLIIDENLGPSLSINDDISFIYKEYQVSEVSVLDGGSNYAQGDVIKPSTGVCKYNSLDEIDVPATFVVDSVGEDGSIESVSIQSNGVYNIAPDEQSDTTGGSGSGAKLNIISSLINNRPIEDRTIAGIELLTNSTLIMLNHPLPPRVMSGEIKAEKWEVTLHTDYMSESKYNVDYDIVKDFTPNYNLPLLRGDLASNHLLHNEAVAIIDKKIKELEEKIDSLGS